MKVAIKKLVSRVEMMLAKAIVKAVIDTDEIQLVKLSVLAGETQDGIERLQNYGFSSVPPTGSEAFVVYLNGNRDHGVVIVCDNGEFRPVGLKDGEAVAYTKHGQTYLLDENGDHVFEGGTDYVAAFTELKAGFDELVAYVNALVLPVTGAVLINPLVPAVAGPPPPPGSTASIDASKVLKIRVP